MEDRFEKQQFCKSVPFLYHLKGVLYAIIFLASSAFGSVTFLLPLLIFVKPISVHWWRKLTKFVVSSWFLFFIWVFEKGNGFEIILTGDKIMKSDYCILMSNHPSESDWLFFWSLIHRKFDLSWHKVLLKDMLLKIPGPGWAIDCLGYLFVTRDGEKDVPQIAYSCNKFLEDSDPLMLCVFPEGTDFSIAKRNRCHQYADAHGLPKYERLLTPRTKGLEACITGLRPRLTAIYDLTYAFEDNVYPTMWSAWTGWHPTRIHLHLNRYSIKQVPLDSAGISRWCYKVFSGKDQMLNEFTKHNRFDADRHQTWEDLQGAFHWCILWLIATSVMLYLFATNMFFRWSQIAGWIAFVSLQFNLFHSRYRIGFSPS
eukprot:TRINITY_DN10128_c0_g1_i1.p1 TRINITY_DN10128_c0_g1~~TRINITY_DN10128_c0_g1_i1.p1  ORF type:complete len:370 (-),score=62.46 TRINITY_DN10128_c0_g1_i1:30-1139(-)